MMWDWLDEKAIVRASIPEWKPFLFSREIFWPLSFDRKNPLHGPIIPRLSAGRLLLAVRILQILSKDDFEIKKASENEINQLSELINTWRANWEKKINLEIPVRTRQWQQMMNEMRSSEGISDAGYKNQIYIRVILDLLLKNANSPDVIIAEQQLAVLDRILKMLTNPTEFIWNENLRKGFPEDQYWYLYRIPSGSKKR